MLNLGHLVMLPSMLTEAQISSRPVAESCNLFISKPLSQMLVLLKARAPFPCRWRAFGFDRSMRASRNHFYKDTRLSNSEYSGIE